MTAIRLMLVIQYSYFNGLPSPFHDGGRYLIETSPLICGANQWTGFYMISASIIKGLILWYITYKNGLTHFKTFATNAEKFLKCVRPFWKSWINKLWKLFHVFVLRTTINSITQLITQKFNSNTEGCYRWHIWISLN